MATVTEERAHWPALQDSLRRMGLVELAAWAFEAGGPLTLLGAQALYFGSPLLRPCFAPGVWRALTSLLEDEAEGRAFAAYLRGEEVSR
jgi:hypothetical protein